ncbi:GIY-YIG nuclease family protein [Gammaproteobacteria bacterium]|nr:GIY-YIG nuclease family protein [Gammaproteobacteria bacterium]
MTELTLKDLIKLEEPSLDSINFKIVRHKMNQKGWEDFDNLIRFDNEMLSAFAGSQERLVYKDADIILTFVALPGTKALFRTAHINHGQISFNQYKKYYKGYKPFLNYRKINSREESVLDDHFFYKLEDSNLLEAFKNRLVIEWGKSTVSWVQSSVEKEVTEIYPKGFVSLFPGWDKVHLSHKELTEIINNPNGNKDWYEYLSRHSGVYVIFDSSTGNQYVGSASGGNGIWSRWEGYVRTGHNGNKGLKALAKDNPDFANTFTYSLHHVFPKTVSKKDVLYYESLLKNKLGSRAFGLNEN